VHDDGAVRVSQRADSAARVSTPAQRLLQYVPSPTAGTNTLSTGAFSKTVRDDKASFRIDGNTRLFGLLTGYYFLDDYALDNPYPGQQGGANVPGFDALTIGRAQLCRSGARRRSDRIR